MKSVDLMLQPVPAGPELQELANRTFICHDCEGMFKYISDELYYFPEQDATYHKHKDGRFCRAFVILEDGTIQIGGFDSVEENVIQQPVMTLDGRGGVEFGDGEAERFFQSMQRQKRKVAPASFEIRWE